MVVEMFIFSVDFSENSLLAEQLDISSLYNLPVMNKLLIEQQLINFVDFSVKKAYLIAAEKNLDFSLFDAVAINENELFKELVKIDNNERFIAFRNDVYFEANDFDRRITENDDLFLLKDKNGLFFCAFGTVGQLKRLYNKNISLHEILKSTKNNAVFCQEIYDGYVMRLDSIKNYKSLLSDVLNGKTFFKPPFIAEGIFTDGNVPEGDYSIIPPVYIGDLVQIESGSVIGPDTVIYNNTLVAESTTIMNSVLFENVYVSSDCFVYDSVCCNNSSIKRNSAVFSNSVIGANALIGEDITVENDSIINKNVKLDKFAFLPLKKNKMYYYGNRIQGLFPDKAALLGTAFANAFKNPKVIIACDGSAASLSIKLAFISGLMASGSECLDIGAVFKSRLFFSSNFCDCEYSVFISNNGGVTDMEFFDSGNNKLSKTQCCNLFHSFNKGEFKYKKGDECKNVRQIKGLGRMYIREITAFSDTDLPYVSEVVCDNPFLLKTLNEIFEKCTSEKAECSSLILYMNESGTNVKIKFGEKVYSQKTLKKLVNFYVAKDQNLKIFESNLYKKLWRCDSVFLVMSVLNIIKSTGKDIDVLIGALPRFFIKSNNLNMKYTDGAIAEKLSSKFRINHLNDSFKIKCNKGFVMIKNNSTEENVEVIAASECMAISDELCGFFTELLLPSQPLDNITN